MNTLTRSIGLLVTLSLMVISSTAFAQDWGPRSLEELKAEILHRTSEEGWRGVKYEDAERAVAELQSLDRDHWAAVWSGIADGYMARAEELKSSSPAEARANYLYAFRYYNTGRWPTECYAS